MPRDRWKHEGFIHIPPYLDCRAPEQNLGEFIDCTFMPSDTKAVPIDEIMHAARGDKDVEFP